MTAYQDAATPIAGQIQQQGTVQPKARIEIQRSSHTYAD